MALAYKEEIMMEGLELGLLIENSNLSGLIVPEDISTAHEINGHLDAKLEEEFEVLEQYKRSGVAVKSVQRMIYNGIAREVKQIVYDSRRRLENYRKSTM
jgi:hypothetical protein